MMDKIIESMKKFIKNYKIYLDLTCLLPNNFGFKNKYPEYFLYL